MKSPEACMTGADTNADESVSCISFAFWTFKLNIQSSVKTVIFPDLGEESCTILRCWVMAWPGAGCHFYKFQVM